MVLVNYRRLSCRIRGIVVADIIKQEDHMRHHHQQQQQARQQKPFRLGSGFLSKTWFKTNPTEGQQHDGEAVSDLNNYCDQEVRCEIVPLASSPAPHHPAASSVDSQAGVGDCSSSTTRKALGETDDKDEPLLVNPPSAAAGGGAAAAAAPAAMTGTSAAASAAMTGKTTTITGEFPTTLGMNTTLDYEAPSAHGPVPATAAAGQQEPQLLTGTMEKKMLSSAQAAEARRVEGMVPQGPSVLFFAVVVSISWILINVTGTLLMVAFLLLGATSGFIIAG